MAGAIISAVLGMSEKLGASFLRLSFGSSPPQCTSLSSIRKDIEKLCRTLTRIRAVLDDAEDREIRDISIQLWLRELEGLAYDAEDVLDEFQYELLLHSYQVSDFVSSPHSPEIFAFLEDVAPRIEQFMERFGEIAEARHCLHLKESDGERRFDTPTTRPPTTSALLEESQVIGREEDKKKIVDLLLLDAETSRNSNVSVIPIVGMGGLGKTTLAQLVYNDDVVEKHFDLKLWVCVSENFDLVRLTREIIESVTKEACCIGNLDPLQVILMEKLAMKRFLLVLDDVWNDDKPDHWETLGIPLLAGAKGSKIIITTRSEKISTMMGGFQNYRLGYLSNNDNWLLFSQRAFEGRDLVVQHNLKEIGWGIVEKCKGLPLVSKTLGGLLRYEDDVSVWNDILNSDIWDIAEGMTNILTILGLSYNHLPAHLKRCFTYCSVFPKDYRFNKDRLIRIWMAHGYILPEGKKQMEDIGRKYFDELLWRSFFQRSQNDDMFVMHDLIHDLAKSISGEECSSMEDDKLCSISENTRHLSVVFDSDLQPVSSPLRVYESRTLRSFLLITMSGVRIFSDSKLANDCFLRLKYLRVLDLSFTGITDLPVSIGSLKCLRYFGLKSVPIRHLPEWMGTLYNLQTLDLGDYVSYSKLPNNMPNWLNLRHLICSHSFLYPVGIKKLVNLQTMPSFVISQERGYAKMEELKGLKNLRILGISQLQNLVDAGDAQQANLENKECLRTLELHWGVPCVAVKVLESLKPHTNLRELSMNGFKGFSLPSWLGHPSFFNLAIIKLFRCVDWTTLPPLGQLPSLKVLYIEHMNRIKYFGREFFIGGFPSLVKLELHNIFEWKAWCGAEKGECPHLRELSITNCGSLESLTLINLGALECLRIDGSRLLDFSDEEQLPSTLKVFTAAYCPALTEWCRRRRRRLAHIPTLEVTGLNVSELELRNVVSVEEARDAHLKASQSLRTLKLVWDPDSPRPIDKEAVEVLWDLKPHTNLSKLVVKGYRGLRFAGWLGSPYFSNLVFMQLLSCSECKVLPSLGQLPHLVELYLEGMHGVKCIGRKFYCSGCMDGGRRCFPSLRKLEFKNMAKWKDWSGMDEGDLTSLSHLSIKHCPRLKGLPLLPPTLKELELAYCDEMMVAGSLTHLTTLFTLRISHLQKELADLPHTITELVIEGCMKLTTIPILPSLRDLVVKESNAMMVLNSLPSLTALATLRISQIPKLTCLPLHNLMALRELHISSCLDLISLDCFSSSSSPSPIQFWHLEHLQALVSLRHLSLRYCPMLHFSADVRLPTELKDIDIINCPLLEEWYQRALRKRADISNSEF